MKVLITGGAGLAGHALADVLKPIRAHTFAIVDNLLYDNEYFRDVEFHFGDVGDPKFMIPFLKEYDPDIVVHFAGVVGDAACDTRPGESKNVNVDSVKLLRDHFGGRIIFTSSCSVYGASEEIVTEKSSLNPHSMYAQMKIQAEEILKDRALILRLGTLCGTSGRFRNDLVVNVFTIRALIEGEIVVFGGAQYRPFLHVQDLAKLVVSQLGAMDVGIFNLLERNYRIIDVANIVKEELPETKIDVVEMPNGDQRDYQVSAERAKELLSFNPSLGVRDGIRDVIIIYKEGRIKNFSHIKYSNMLALRFKARRSHES